VLLLGGLTTLGLAQGRTAWVAAGATALGLDLLQWLAESQGYPVPRPGRTRIVPYGSWEQPLAFAVRRKARTLLFFRRFESAAEELATEYQVFGLPPMDESDIRIVWGTQPLPEGHLLGSIPVAALAFEHGSRSYVRTSSLRAVESRLSAPEAGPA
jgi:hypothetical protein